MHKRLNKKAQQDPSFLLLNNMTSVTPRAANGRAGSQQLFQGDNIKNAGNQMQLRQKILSGPKSRLSKSKTAAGAPLLLNDRRRQQYAEYDKVDEKKS